MIKVQVLSPCKNGAVVEISSMECSSLSPTLRKKVLKFIEMSLWFLPDETHEVVVTILHEGENHEKKDI